MWAVRNAVALLTRFPVATADTDTPGASAFAIVGAGVGLVGAIPLAVLAGVAGEPLLGAIAAVAMVALVTGALHLDGLGDTADALMARDAVAAERARTDPVLGTGGVITIILVIATEIAALVSITTGVGALTAGLTFVATLTASRTVPLVVRWLGRARTGDTPLGSWFAERVTPLDTGLACGSGAVIVAALAIAASSLGSSGTADATTVTAAGAAAAVIGSGLAAIIVALRRALDGDGMGAAVELSVVAGLVAAALVA
jgi:adenosylcobinamide-GDP ribazoletransferase